MNRYGIPKKNRLNTAEKRSEKLLIEKMGLEKKELDVINEQYGVSASQIIELMQYSKYQFVYRDRSTGQCQPCKL